MAFPEPTASPPKFRYLRPEDMRRFKNLWFASRTIVEGAYSGQHKSPFRGASQEFTDYREYAPGDELRTIDWKAFARTDRYFVKLFEKETDMTCYLLVDSSASMAFGGKAYERYLPSAGLSKFEYACFLAAAIGYLTVKQGDKVGLTVFDREIKTQVPPGGTFPHLYRILNRLEDANVGRNTSISEVLRMAFPTFRRKGLLILISDFLDDVDEIFDSLGMYRHRNFEVIMLQVLHASELELPSFPNAKFIDSETMERVTTTPADIRDAYTKQLRSFTDALASRAAAQGIDYQILSTEHPFDVALEKFIRRRRR